MRYLTWLLGLSVTAMAMSCNQLFLSDVDFVQGGSGTGANATGAGGVGAGQTGGATTGGAGGDGATGGAGASSTGGTGGGCTPDCNDRFCGPDGCDGLCGLCDDGFACDFVTGSCERFCGIECGAECGTCPGTLACSMSGICLCGPCTPNCSGKTCGDDECGGLCGAGDCGPGEVCAVDTSDMWSCEAFAGTEPSMSFFVTSRGTGPAGGNLGGLAGADAMCQHFAEEVGVLGKAWRAYLSTSTVDARDRIGPGPWFNAKGQDVCGGDCQSALYLLGIPPALILTERGTLLDHENERDIFTGSNGDGTGKLNNTCLDWTSNSPLDNGRVGHVHDQNNWANAHDQACDQEGMRCKGGGNFYCFAM